MMRIAMTLSALGAAAMFALIGMAAFQGHFLAEGSLLYALAWGKVTLADLYAGFALFAGWLLFREAKISRAIFFIVLVGCLGNAFTLVYVTVALARSRGRFEQFFLGHRATQLRPKERAL